MADEHTIDSALDTVIPDHDPLQPEHRADLKSSGLTADTIALMRVYSMSPQAVALAFPYNAARITSALAFPYLDAEGNKNGFLRAKVFPMIENKDGHKTKYLQKKTSTPHLYFLSPVIEKLSDPKIPLYIVEGEKKTAKAVQSGLCAVGIGGLWNWVQKGTPKLVTDFEAINVWRRTVILVPDSDTWGENKKDLKLAVFALSKQIKDLGATIKVKVL